MHFSAEIYPIFSISYAIAFIYMGMKHYRSDLISSAHYAVLSLVSIYGLASALAGLLGISLSLSVINLATLLATICLGIWLKLYHQEAKIITKWIIRRDIIISHTSSFILALIAGLLFYTIDLVPSSMTGDPPRHFMAINVIDNLPATTHKPIYYVWGGIFINYLPVFAKDQAFVIFNILCLGLSTSSSMLVFCRVFPNTNIPATFTTSLLISFGYAFFALQYGYFTLLLSSAFLFTAFALLLEYKIHLDEKIYALVTLIALGVVLTHSYLAPDVVFSMVLFSVWNARLQGVSFWHELRRHAPHWFLVIGVAVVSSVGLVPTSEAVNSLEKIIATTGFVNNEIFLNLLPFLPLTLGYFLQQRKDEAAHALLILLLAITSFSLAMGILYWSGYSAPYYLNRNQIALLPLMIMACIGFIVKKNWQRPTTPNSILALICLAVLIPYLIFNNRPLSLSTGNLEELLSSERLVYFENPINAGYSPLQMTDSDRTLMRNSGLVLKTSCLTGLPAKIATLGTDHEVLWFQIYTGIYPSLFERKDGFIEIKNYLQNYKEWKTSPNQSYIAVMGHSDFFNLGGIVADIRSRSSLICKGDSFEIYRKRS